jgi:hypothetical protein
MHANTRPEKGTTDESGEWVMRVQRGSDAATLPITVTDG